MEPDGLSALGAQHVGVDADGPLAAGLEGGGGGGGEVRVDADGAAEDEEHVVVWAAELEAGRGAPGGVGGGLGEFGGRGDGGVVCAVGGDVCDYVGGGLEVGLGGWRCWGGHCVGGWVCLDWGWGGWWTGADAGC